MSVDTSPSRIDALLARAFLWRVLAAAFRYPDATTHREVVGAESWRRAAERAEELGWPEVARAARAAGDAACGLSRDALEAAHTAAFGHSVRCAAPPYETEWGGGDGLTQLHEIADVAAFFRAHGLRAASGGERADHVSLEAEFLAFLLVKEARALQTGRTEEAAICSEGRGKFLEEHLARFVPAFASRLAGSDVDRTYPTFAVMLDALARAECAASGVACGDEAMSQRPITEEDRACASCPVNAPLKTPK